MECDHFRQNQRLPSSIHGPAVFFVKFLRTHTEHLATLLCFLFFSLSSVFLSFLFPSFLDERSSPGIGLALFVLFCIFLVIICSRQIDVESLIEIDLSVHKHMINLPFAATPSTINNVNGRAKGTQLAGAAAGCQNDQGAIVHAPPRALHVFRTSIIIFRYRWYQLAIVPSARRRGVCVVLGKSYWPLRKFENVVCQRFSCLLACAALQLSQALLASNTHAHVKDIAFRIACFFCISVRPMALVSFN